MYIVQPRSAQDDIGRELHGKAIERGIEHLQHKAVVTMVTGYPNNHVCRRMLTGGLINIGDLAKGYGAAVNASSSAFVIVGAWR